MRMTYDNSDKWPVADASGRVCLPGEEYVCRRRRFGSLRRDSATNCDRLPIPGLAVRSKPRPPY